MLGVTPQTARKSHDWFVDDVRERCRAGGMVLDIAMGISEDFALQPAHAHLNLLGGVLLFLFGLYHRLVPAAGASQLAKVQR